MRFFDLEQIKLIIKSLSEQILQIGSFSIQNALDLMELQDLYDNNVVINKSIDGRLIQNINIDTTFGNEDSNSVGISTYEFLSGSQLLYDKILPPENKNPYEVANFGTVLNLLHTSATNNIGFYTFSGITNSIVEIVEATSGVSYNFLTFFDIDDDTHILTCVTPCVLFYMLTTKGSEGLASAPEIDMTIDSVSSSIIVGGIPGVLQGCLQLDAADTVNFKCTGTSINYYLTLVAFAQ